MNRDGTGPAGAGPMTGRGMGYCRVYDMPMFGCGYGRGRGFGRNRGFGRSAGFGRGFWAMM